MKKALLKAKTKRFGWAVLFSIIFLTPLVVSGLSVVAIFGGWRAGIHIWAFLGALGTMYLTNLIWSKPAKWLHTIFFAPKMEELDMEVKQYITKINEKRMAMLSERDDVIQSKIEIVEELSDFDYTIETTNILRNITSRINDIHANEPKNKNIIDLRDINITKKEFKKFKKEVINNVKNVKVSRLNADKLKDIEEIITGKAAKQKAIEEEAHRKAIEIANAGAQQTIVVPPQMLPQAQEPLKIPTKEETIEYAIEVNNIETEKLIK